MTTSALTHQHGHMFCITPLAFTHHHDHRQHVTTCSSSQEHASPPMQMSNAGDILDSPRRHPAGLQ
eukprot:663415-Alexandrium_andersonii.AAC.1